MKRIVIAAAAALLLAPQAFAGTGGAWNKSFAAAKKEAAAGKKLIFVDMFADWCGWCHKMEKEVFPSAAFQNATDKMVLLRLDTEDGGEGTNFARQYSVTTLPTFLLIAHDGTLAGLIRGYAPANDFVKSLDEVQNKYKSFQDRVANEKTIAKDYQKRLELAREFSQRFSWKNSESRLKLLTMEKGVPANIRDQAFYELAVAQFMQKKHSEALGTVKAFGQVQKTGEAFERARLLVGQVYLEQGNLLGAANEFRRFKTDFPNSPLVRNVDMVLPDIERRLRASTSK